MGDFNAMRRKKLNSRFEFPLNLNMQKFTKEGLAQIERAEKKKKSKKGKDDEKKKEDVEVEEELLPLHPNPKYYEYSLAGVVVHTGGAEAGHYYSYAQSSG